MKIYTCIEEFAPIEFPVVTIGTFDGVHIGHQAIINKLKEVAERHNGETILVTFDPHPRKVLYSDSWDLKLINSPKRKIDLIRKTGIDHLIILPFTKKFAQMSSYEFIKNILVDKIHTKNIVIGYDHHFGRDRLGDHQSLEELGKEFGFRVDEVPPQYIDKISVSSTKIRKALNDGNITYANKLLGYEYSIHGNVVEGFKIGRTIGFPTANLEVDDKLKLITANGVYACKVLWNGQKFFGMGNIGVRPTLNRKDLTIEVHIFDFDKQIYGDYLTIYWIDRIRDEIKFKDLEALKEQLVKDKKTVLRILNKKNND